MVRDEDIRTRVQEQMPQSIPAVATARGVLAFSVFEKLVMDCFVAS